MDSRWLAAGLIGTATGVAGGLVLLLAVRAAVRPRPAAPPPVVQAPPSPTPAPTPAPRPEPPAPAPAVSEWEGPSAGRLEAVRAVLEAEARRLPGAASVHLALPGGRGVGGGSDGATPAGGMITLPLLAAVHHAWHSGALVRTPADEERLRAAVLEGDLEAADFLLRRVGVSQANEWLAGAGFADTAFRRGFVEQPGARRLGENTTSAADLARLLLAVADGSLVDAGACTEMRRLLAESQRRSRLPAGLPEGLRVANLAGTGRGAFGDAALVEGVEGLRYALAVLVVAPGGERAATRGMARLAGRVHAALTEGP